MGYYVCLYVCHIYRQHDILLVLIIKLLWNKIHYMKPIMFDKALWKQPICKSIKIIRDSLVLCIISQKPIAFGSHLRQNLCNH